MNCVRNVNKHGMEQEVAGGGRWASGAERPPLAGQQADDDDGRAAAGPRDVGRYAPKRVPQSRASLWRSLLIFHSWLNIASTFNSL